jgi:hypothetical protein
MLDYPMGRRERDYGLVAQIAPDLAIALGDAE